MARFFILILSLLTSAAFARAEAVKCPDKPEDAESAQALAGTWFDKAVRLAEEQRYAEAVQSFACSSAMVEHPATYYNAAKAAVLGNDDAAALPLFKRHLELAPDSEFAAEVRAEIARIEAKPDLQALPQPAPEVLPQPEVEPQPEFKLAPEPEEKSGTRPPALKLTGIALIAAGGLGAVTGAVLQGLAGRAKDKTERQSTLDDFKSTEDKMKRYQAGAYVGFIGGGALIAAGAALLVVHQRRGTMRPETLQVTMAPFGGGLSAELRF